MRRPGRPTMPIVLTEGQQRQLEAMAHSRSLPHGRVVRAQIVLMAAKGMTNTQIAPHVGLSIGMVGIWRKRFLKQGVEGLRDEPRPGRPRSVSDQRVAEVIEKTLSSKPKGATQWSCRSMAGATSLSKDTINRIWQAFNLKPHRQKHFSLSTDPFFVDKVRDVVGLYLDPPDHALVLCVDEKSQIQALDRTQPILPLGLGGHSSHCGQLRDPQEPESERMARQTASLPCPLHAYLYFLAQPSGNMVWHYRAKDHSPRNVPQCHRTRHPDSPFCEGV